MFARLASALPRPQAPYARECEQRATFVKLAPDRRERHGQAWCFAAFDDDFAKYLDEAIRQHVNPLRVKNFVLDDIRVEERRAEIVKEELDHLKWLNEQLIGVADKFKPFLKLDKRQRAPRRW